MPSFNPSFDLPADLSSKTIVVTGGTAGVGKELVLTLSRAHNPRIFFTGRNRSAGDAIIKEARKINSAANLTFIESDFADLHSTYAAGQEIASQIDRLDILFANAGIMAVPPALSKDGFEIQFAVNHLGNSMMLRTLLPALQKTAATGADTRIVFTTSTGYQFSSSIRYDQVRSKQESWLLGGFQRYSQGKLANLWYPAVLARRHPGILSTSVTPGVIQTDLVKNLDWFNRWFTNITTLGHQSTVQEAVQSLLWPAFAERGKVISGAFYEPVGRVGKLTTAAADEVKAEELVKWTEQLLVEYAK